MSSSSKDNRTNKTLGRGLAALFGEVGGFDDNDISSIQEPHLVKINFLKPGKMQPRQTFDDEKMDALTESIKRKGVLQPLLVRKKDENEYEIIAGERRWRAATKAGLNKVPVIELNCNDEEALEIGLIENLQRDDLNPLEEAESFLRLINEHKKTHDEIAIAISKSRSYVSNMLRLNNLPEKVKDLVHSGKLSAGHARSIAIISNVEEIAEKIVNEKLSVRDAETLVRKEKTKNPLNQQPPIDPDIVFLTQKIGERLGMKTKLQLTREGGALTFFFHSYEQLDDLIGYLSTFN